MNRFINESLNYVKQQEGLKLIEFITSYQLRKAQYVNMCPLLFSGNSNLLDSKESELKSEVLIKMLSFNNEKPDACKRRVIEQSEELTNVKASQQSKRNQLIKLFNIIPIKNQLKYQDQANKNKEKDSGIFNQIDKHQKVEENIELNLIDKQNEGSSEIQLNQDDFIAYAQSEDQRRKSTIKQVQSQQDLDDNWHVERDSIRFSQFNRIESIGSNSKVNQKTVFRVSQQALILGKTRKIYDQPIQGHQQHTLSV